VVGHSPPRIAAEYGRVGMPAVTPLPTATK
jgi:hypothetical protein